MILSYGASTKALQYLASRVTQAAIKSSTLKHDTDPESKLNNNNNKKNPMKRRRTTSAITTYTTTITKTWTPKKNDRNMMI